MYLRYLGLWYQTYQSRDLAYINEATTDCITGEYGAVEGYDDVISVSNCAIGLLLGYYCLNNLCGSDGDTELSIEAQVFDVSSSVLQIKEPTFEMARIGQSTASPGGTATVTVSLQTNVDVAGLAASAGELSTAILVGARDQLLPVTSWLQNDVTSARD